MAQDRKSQESNGGPPPAASPPAASNQASSWSERFTDEVTIEVGDERNRSVLWAPTKDLLRGAWKRQNLNPDELVESVAQMPDIPGQGIYINGRTRTLSVVDLLNRPENSAVWDEIVRLMRAWHGKDVRRVEDRVVTASATDSQIKTWLYWVHRLLLGVPRETTRRPHTGGPQARVVSGRMPSLKDLRALPGRVHVNLYDASSRRRYLEDIPEEEVEA